MHEGAIPPPASLRVIISDPALRVIMLVVFVIMLGFGIVAPILPLFARSFGVSYGAAGLLISAFAFTRLAFDLFAGPIVDKWGEQRASVAALLFVAASSVLTGLAPNFPSAVVLRAAGGAGSAVLFAALYSYLLRIVPAERMARASGLFYGAFNVGIIAGGPLGGVIAGAFGLRAPLYFYAGVLVVSAVFFRRFVPDPPRASRPDGSAANKEGFFEVLKNPAIFRVATMNFAYLWMIVCVYDTLMPLFARFRLGMSPTTIGAVLAIALVTEMLVMYPSGVLADRLGRKPVAISTFTWLVVIVALVGFSTSRVIFFVVMALVGTATGSTAVIPTAILGDVAAEGSSGTAVGIFRFAGDLGMTLGPLAVGLTTNAVGFKAAFVVAVLPSFLALLDLFRMPETLKRA